MVLELHAAGGDVCVLLRAVAAEKRHDFVLLKSLRQEMRRERPRLLEAAVEVRDA
jgi:hypothetical protein